MRKYIFLGIMFFIIIIGKANAQTASKMTDDQVMSFVVKEHARGTSNSQIVTRLMHQGVDISQIRRVRNNYE